MSATHPFAGFNPKPSAWGYNWTAVEQQQQPVRPTPTQVSPEPPQQQQQQQQYFNPMPDQFANMPAALLSTLKREKKPFTYTPGGVNLSEVLNARLQKRIERKKKYSEERATDPPKQVMVMPTYNTPLDMYSMANALEALEVQAELVAGDKSLSSPSRSATLPRNHTFRFDDDMDPGRGVAQSKAFRVLQIITDTEEESCEKPRPQHHDEMRFTGLRENKADIPSRFFHTLQKITGTDEEAAEEQTRTDSGHTFEKPRPAAPHFVVQKESVRQVPPPAQPSSAPAALRRPAAFLPIKTSPGFRPVQPPRVSNGPIGRIVSAGTDF